jgi:iron complex outermembrane recepter protein
MQGASCVIVTDRYGQGQKTTVLPEIARHPHSVAPCMVSRRPLCPAEESRTMIDERTRRSRGWQVAARVVALAFASSQASAQDATRAAPPAALETIVVTGSRIVIPGVAVSNPVMSVGAKAIETSGVTDVTDYLKTLPALVASRDKNDAAGSSFIGGTGLTLLDLRNLGEDRTLVLVDGRRHVAGLPGSAAVDVDTIPFALLERVDIQTGGASALYGADGVSGVVNFILKRDFEGSNVRAQYGSSAEGDADTLLVSGVLGQNVDDGRGNVTVALEYSKEKRLRANQRDFAGGGNRFTFQENPADLDDDPAVPDQIPLRDVRFWDSGPAGAVDVDFDFSAEEFFSLQDFNGDDAPWDFGDLPLTPDDGPPIPPFYQQGGDGSRRDQFIGDLTPDEDRYTFNALFTYEITSAARVFADLKYSRTKAFTESQPSFDFFLFLEPDYAFTPPNIAAAAAGNALLVSRDHFDLGIRGEDIERDTRRAVVGVDGEVIANTRYEVSLVYGETEVNNLQTNNRFNDRFAAALDAVVDPVSGDIVCRSNLDPSAEPANLAWNFWDGFEPLPGTWAGSFTPGPDSGCVPVNILGTNAVSREAADWIMTDSLAFAKIEQFVVTAYLTGDTANLFELPAGPIGWAAGVEYREEKSKSIPAAEDQAGLTFNNVLLPVDGKYDVSELFAEVNIPLVADQPFADILSVDGAVRYSDYSTTGTATTWKAGLTWGPVHDLRLTGTIAEATRAPNIGELFDPGGQTFELIDDPCDVDNLNEGSEFRAANCAALLTSLGVDPTTYTDPNSASIPGSLVGNPNLTEEVAESVTFGVEYRPRWADELLFRVDYYDIELTDAINTASAQVTANQCVDLPTLDNDFCALQTREPGFGGVVDFVLQPLNVAKFTTEGYDFQATYQLDSSRLAGGRDYGVFTFRLIGNKLEDLTFINLPGAAPDEDLGQGPIDDEDEAPEWQAIFDAGWERGPLYLNYEFSWFDETDAVSPEELAGEPDIREAQYLKFSAREVHDLYARYSLEDGLSIYAGVNNLTDEKPDIGATYYPVGAVGRFFYAGLTWAAD